MASRINKLNLALTGDKDLSKKLLLRRNNQGLLEFRSHRSHRSHSSHRSHYSSSGSAQIPKSQPKSEPKSSSSSGIKPNYLNDNSSLSSGYVLGSRVLKLGMSGNDVTELINILLRKRYLALDDGGMTVTGVYTYDSIIEDAVKRFQTDNGLDGTGVCDVKTVYILKD